MSTRFLEATDHRPWPMPARPWLWRQRWDQVLLLHWRVAPTTLRPLLPEGLPLDLYDGSAWVTLVPFRMRNVRPRGLPALSRISNFVELNLRTYVTRDERPGVYFLRIQADSALAAWLGRTLSPLPYEFAALVWRARGAEVRFESPELLLEFTQGTPREARSAQDVWLTERYCMYAAPRGDLVRAEVHHAPWRLSTPLVRLERNRALEALDSANPLLPDAVHFSPGVEIVGWTAERLSSG